MYNMLSNEKSVFTHPLRVNARNAEDLINKASGLAALKDVDGTYLLTSKHETQFSGFTPEEFYGLTIEDISQRAQFLKGSKEKFIDTIKKIDYQVKSGRYPIFMKEVYVTHHGFIKVDNLMKSPIMGQDNKVIAILSYCEDLTVRLNLFDLFSLYRKFYLPHESIRKFLEYFNAKHYFQALPTYTEMLVIIAMSLDTRHKAVSELLKKTPRTISSHSFSINQKLKLDINLQDVLFNIRNADKNTCSVEDWLTD